MDEARDVVPINDLIGMPVLSRASGNKLGVVRDILVDQVDGVLSGLTVATDHGIAALSYEEIYSFGPDAIMANADNSTRPADEAWLADGPHAREHLIGTKVLTESGRLLGNISNVFVTLKPPPFVVYEVRESIFDKLLGRQLYILPSSGYAISSDGERLVVPEETVEAATQDISALINRTLTVRTYNPPAGNSEASYAENDTWVPRRDVDDDETIIRVRDEDETVLRPPRPAK